MGDIKDLTVSVVIPCFNYGKYLEEAIDSCLNSTFRDIEIIVVNDGSTDPDTISVLENLQKPKTRVIHQENKGLPCARNTGIAAAKGKYILPLDADDTIEPTYIEKAVAVLESKPGIGFVSAGIRHFGDYNKEILFPPINFYSLLFKNEVTVCSMFRKKAWSDVGGYNELMRQGFEDWDFWISLMKRGWLGYRIPEVLFNYRRHGKTMLHYSNKIRKQLFRQIQNNHPELYRKERLEQLKKQWVMSQGKKTKPVEKKQTKHKKRVNVTSWTVHVKRK
ncbi:glycosyltransferase family A protein [Ammoniphilus sp. YIM 78166]|uniref:glycosyltransferase family 2 protein n=1 Tax=Ammoniphilus sp. YIM 78166 TaxID=1644106 RepID=UPI00107009E6|nr:glycosyltransferase family A protein [Ammoniphilus sp. YIM 78166]